MKVKEENVFFSFSFSEEEMWVRVGLGYKLSEGMDRGGFFPLVERIPTAGTLGESETADSLVFFFPSLKRVGIV